MCDENGWGKTTLCECLRFAIYIILYTCERKMHSTNSSKFQNDGGVYGYVFAKTVLVPNRLPNWFRNPWLPLLGVLSACSTNSPRRAPKIAAKEASKRD
jgi:hypothetical protein